MDLDADPSREVADPPRVDTGPSREDEVAAQASAIAAAWSPPDAPPEWWLTAATFTAIARDDVLRAVAAALPPDRMPALLLAAAISRLVAERAPQPLADYYPRPGGHQPPDDGGFAAALAAAARSERAELTRLCATHRYQMNEVARCLDVLPVLGTVAAEQGRPVALVDVGTGAGLALHLDRYGYHYTLPDGTVATCGDADATVQLECTVRGSAPPVPDRVPPVLDRTGIDLEPLELSDPQTLGWLAACVPPEVGAVTRFAAAAGIARSSGARTVRGDLLDVLRDVVAAMPREAVVCIIDTYVSVFLPPGRLARLDELVTDLGRARDVEWISVNPLVPLGPDARATVQGLDVPASWLEDNRVGGVFGVIGRVTVRRGVRSGRVLGRAHPGATWLEWLDQGPDQGKANV